MGVHHMGDVGPVNFGSNGTDANPHLSTLRHLSYEEPPAPDTQEILLDRGSFRIRLADSQGTRNHVSMLINRMYSWRGYRDKDLPHGTNQITLHASNREQVFGTLTLGLDSDEGLLADQLYRREIDAYRARGCKVCELTRLAVDPRYGSKEVLASLFHLAYIYGRLLHCATDVFIEVNPRHVGFYQRMLGFHKAGVEKVCDRVGAPAVMLHVELAYVDAQIARYAGLSGSEKRSLYPYFFSKIEEEGLSRRIFRKGSA